MHFWNLLSHDNGGGTVRTYKAKKSFTLYCCTELKHHVWFSFVIEISLWLCLCKQAIWCRKKRSVDQSSRYSRPHIHTISGWRVLLWTELCQVPHTPHVPTARGFFKLSKEANSAADPQEVLEHICAHLEQSSDLWEESTFCVLKLFADPNQCVVSGDNREMNFKTSVLFSTKMLV